MRAGSTGFPFEAGTGDGTRIGEGRVARLIKDKQTDEQAIEELYLAALSRLPTPEEMGKSVVYVAGGPNRQQSLEDVLWSLLNSKEFLFNH